MEKVEIYKKIRNVADTLQKSGLKYTRSDLAYELQGMGVVKDSLEVSKLIWEAYIHYNKYGNIKNAFLDNEGKHKVVSEYEIYQLINKGDNDSLFPLLDRKMSNLDKSFQSLDSDISLTLKGEYIVAASSFMNRVTGTRGATIVQKEAAAALGSYTTLVDSYSSLKSDVQSAITDFVFLRGEIDKVYHKYALTLMDTFGDSIKSVAPSMFDFDSIEWLNVASMLQNIQLEYKTIYDSCETLIADINHNFGNALKESVNSYRNTGSKSMGLIMAGINLFSHYSQAGQQTMQLQNQLLTLKNKMRRDATHIKGDEGRLLVIYKQINDLFIPKASAFYKYHSQIMTEELDQLLNALYQNPEIKRLKEQRDFILSEYKVYEQNKLDNEININYYTNHIAENKDALAKKNSQYQTAKNCKPSRTFFLFNWITFGSLGRSYNRDLYEWNQTSGPLVREYESLQVDVKVDHDELMQQQAELKDNFARRNDLKAELDNMNHEIFSKIRVDNKLKLQIGDHLKSLINLLWLAKDIINSKIDDKLVRIVQISNVEDQQLPKELEMNIQAFTNSLRNIEVGNGFANKSAKYVEKNFMKPKFDENGKRVYETYNEEELANLSIVENKAIQNGIDLLEQWTELKARQVNSEIIGRAYDKQLKQLQISFKRNIQDIDQKSTVLSEVLKRINAADNNEQLKEGLMQLIDINGNNITKDDLEAFFNGTKEIQI